MTPLAERELLRDLASTHEPHFAFARDLLNRAGFDLVRQSKEARRWCIEQALSGRTECQYAAAVLMSCGIFGPMDKSEAFAQCVKAAAQEFAPAMLFLAGFYESGWAGVEVRQDEAVRLMKRAAELRHAPAMTAIALYWLAEGDTVDRRKEALNYLRQASDLDYPHAQVHLADELLKGDPADVSEGIALMKRAAQQDFPHAHQMLGYFHENGKHGFHRDSTKAAIHFRRARELEEISWNGLPSVEG